MVLRRSGQLKWQSKGEEWPEGDGQREGWCNLSLSKLGNKYYFESVITVAACPNYTSERYHFGTPVTSHMNQYAIIECVGSFMRLT